MTLEQMSGTCSMAELHDVPKMYENPDYWNSDNGDDENQEFLPWTRKRVLDALKEEGARQYKTIIYNSNFNLKQLHPFIQAGFKVIGTYRGSTGKTVRTLIKGIRLNAGQ